MGVLLHDFFHKELTVLDVSIIMAPSETLGMAVLLLYDSAEISVGSSCKI